MPLSEMVRVRLSPSVNEISIWGSNENPLSESSVSVRYLSLSIASDAFDISSLRNISLFE